jgi:hypothetical protein
VPPSIQLNGDKNTRDEAYDQWENRRDSVL